MSRLFLGSLLAACGGDQVCHLDQCGNDVCTDLQSDPVNCGTCGSACASDQTCSAGACEQVGSGSGSGSDVCDAPDTSCGPDACVDLDTDAANCGACGSACATTATCMTGRCTNPLVAMHTTGSVDGTVFGRDLFVLDDVTLQLVQLNQPAFSDDSVNRVVDQAILADGRVVFVAGQDTDGVVELYVTSPAGGTATKLNPPLVADGNVQAGIVVRGTTVLYRADQDVAGEIDLYAVDVDKPGQAAKLNGALGSGARVSSVIALSDDATVAAYVADEATPGLDEAFAVSLAAPGVSTKLNAPVANGVWDLALSGDGKFIAYRNDDVRENQPQLFVVALANPGVAVHVDNTVDATYVAQDVYTIVGNQLFYSGSTAFLQDSLWSALVNDTLIDSVQLANGSAGDVRTAFAVVDEVVVYRQRTGDSNAITLFAVPGSGLDSPSALASDPDGVADFAVARDGKHVAYRTGGDGAEGGLVTRGTDGNRFFAEDTVTTRLAEVDLTSGTPVQIELANVTDPSAGIDDGYVVLDDGRVVFLGDADGSGLGGAYLTIAGSADAFVDVSPLLGSASGSAEADSVVQLTRF
nr:hypothetical protein [Kofleriaceae bacterium]